MAYRDSPTWDEIGHFAAGLGHWREGRFDLYIVDPPLVRLVGCAPVRLLTKGDAVDRSFPEPSGERPEFGIGRQLARLYGLRYFWLMSVARWACIPFALIGGLFCFQWARELYGVPSSVLALLLWVISPTVLGFGHLITPDVGAAAMGLGAAYCFWKWLRRPTWGWALMAGLMLGLAELAKTTWLVLLLLWPIFWLANRIRQRGRPDAGRAWPEFIQLAAGLAISIWVINLGYGFEGFGKPLGQYRFVSHVLAGPAPAKPNAPAAWNRFAGTWLGRVPVILPQSYVQGIDYIKMEYERGYWSYLRGQWRHGGWWYYYLYAMLIKEPLGTWALGVLAVILTIMSRRYSAGAWNEIFLLVPAVVVIALVSSQTGFNHHLRYVLPAFGFLFIWISKVGRSIVLRQYWVSGIAAAALGWAVVSSAAVFPHSLSYFNELAGGPMHGHYDLGNSNADWGQDLLYLKKWVERHPSARPLHLAYDLPLIDPDIIGTHPQGVPVGPPKSDLRDYDAQRLGPKPGWYAISVNQLHGRQGYYNYFLKFRPVDYVGYTIYIYHISSQEANRVRAELGLPPLAAPG